MNRRSLLKTAGMMVGASALAGEFATARSNSGQQPTGNGSISKKMMGFMLPHEQFTVPQLVELGVAAEKAGFDLLATSDHFQPWQDEVLPKVGR